MKTKILFIVNPIAGNKKKKNIINDIQQLINKEKYEPEIQSTQYGGHAFVIAKNAVETKIPFIVAVGGDGTINEVARAIVHSSSALGIIPCGSGNGLARHLKIPMSVKEAINIINKGTICTLDYGKINKHPFFCTCGMGFDAFISWKFSRSPQRGPLTYIKKVLKEGLTYQSETYILKTDHKKEETKYHAFLITCGNASQYGNNAYIAPEASMKDGLLDIIIMKPFKLYQAPCIGFGLFNKKLHKNKLITSFRTQKIHIKREKAGAIHCDGDPYEEGENITIEIIPKGFNVIVNSLIKTKKDKINSK